MLSHVPFGDVLLATEVAHEGSYSRVFSQVHLKVGPCVIFFVASLEFTMELVNILMCFFMVPENPHLPEFRLAAGVRTDELA
jgi:hypothetical protein